MWIYFYTQLIFKRLRGSLKAFLVPCRPQQIQHLTSLTSLEIYSIKGVESLPEWLGSPYIHCTIEDFVLRESDEFTKSPSYATPHQITISPYLWMSSPTKGKMQEGQRHRLATRRKTILNKITLIGNKKKRKKKRRAKPLKWSTTELPKFSSFLQLSHDLILVGGYTVTHCSKKSEKIIG
ncbi:unnamed protein product [Malus baccata var. baccata]